MINHIIALIPISLQVLHCPKPTGSTSNTPDWILILMGVGYLMGIIVINCVAYDSVFGKGRISEPGVTEWAAVAFTLTMDIIVIGIIFSAFK